MSEKTLVEEIKQYAIDHYNTAWFWSTIVECYTDDELADKVARYGVTSLGAFVRAAAPEIDVYEDRWNDTRITIEAFGESF